MFGSGTGENRVMSAHINSTHVDSTVVNREQIGRARMGTARTSGGSHSPYAPAERFSSYGASGDFTRKSASESRTSASSAASRDFVRSAASQPVRSGVSSRGGRVISPARLRTRLAEFSPAPLALGRAQRVAPGTPSAAEAVSAGPKSPQLQN